MVDQFIKVPALPVTPTPLVTDGAVVVHNGKVMLATLLEILALRKAKLEDGDYGLITVSGNGTVFTLNPLTVPLLLADGDAAAPGLSFADDETTGFYRDPGNNNLVYVGAGAEFFRFNTVSHVFDVGGTLAFPAIFLRGLNVLQNGNNDASVVLLGDGYDLTWCRKRGAFGPALDPTPSALKAKSHDPAESAAVFTMAGGQTENAVQVRQDGGPTVFAVKPDGGLATTAAIAATAVGACIGVLQINEPGGALVGYVPIYDTFTP